MTAGTEPYIAVTNPDWYAFLRRRTGPSCMLDEVNFWNPSGKPLKHFRPGEPFFLRLKAPYHVLGGYGFFATFRALPLMRAWEYFRELNGCTDPLELSHLTKRPLDAPIGCTVLRDVTLWPDGLHVQWSSREGWRGNGPNRGKTETDPERVQQLLDYIGRDNHAVPEDLSAEAFRPLEIDDREIVLARTRQRSGQGTFRTRLLGAYNGRCAVTGEHTEVVLDAAHIQPYLGPRSNHLQNGILLTKEFHALFDEGYATITPNLRVRISPRLRDEWDNGHRYYPFDGRPLEVEPRSTIEKPSAAVLAWHGERIFKS